MELYITYMFNLYGSIRRAIISVSIPRDGRFGPKRGKLQNHGSPKIVEHQIFYQNCDGIE